jgi:hypothetical protein
MRAREESATANDANAFDVRRHDIEPEVRVFGLQLDALRNIASH